MFVTFVVFHQVAEFDAIAIRAQFTPGAFDAFDTIFVHAASNAFHERIIAYLIISILIKVSKKFVQFSLCQTMTILLQSPRELMSTQPIILRLISSFKAPGQSTNTMGTTGHHSVSDPGKDFLWGSLVNAENWVVVGIFSTAHKSENL